MKYVVAIAGTTSGHFLYFLLTGGDTRFAAENSIFTALGILIGWYLSNNEGIDTLKYCKHCGKPIWFDNGSGFRWICWFIYFRK